MGNMRFKINDRVRIKSLDWYNENKDEYGNIDINYYFTFYADRSKYCGKVFTISEVFDNCYTVKEDNNEYYWTDEMIEGLVEEESKPEPNFKIGDKIKLKSTLLNDVFGVIGHEPNGYRITNISNGLTHFMSYTTENNYELVEEEMSLDEAGQITDFEYEGLAYTLPEGYQFVDENGNVINAAKIVLEKKKKEYPKTYEECCLVLEYIPYTNDVIGYEWDVLKSLQNLLICRDAYWKIAGEEMGLDKPWKPDWEDESDKFTIGYFYNDIDTDIIRNYKSYSLAFPTKEIRDAFYENFKELIEQCKKLL